MPSARGRRKPLAQRIRSARIAAGLSQVDLADQAGVSRRTIWNLEHGVQRHPMPHKLAAVAKVLELDVDVDLNRKAS